MLLHSLEASNASFDASNECSNTCFMVRRFRFLSLRSYFNLLVRTGVFVKTLVSITIIIIIIIRFVQCEKMVRFSVRTNIFTVPILSREQSNQFLAS